MEEKTKSKGYVLRKLFFACLYLSTFTFGGGYVIVTLLKEKFVDHYHWIEEDEMLDLVAIAQSSPGAIAVNGAIIVGYKLAGIPGMLVGYSCDSSKLDDGSYSVKLTIEAVNADELSDTDEASQYTCRPAADNRVVVIRSSYMGEGSEELGKVLIKGFIYALSQQDNPGSRGRTPSARW